MARFYEQFDRIWTCSNCNGAVPENVLEGLKEAGMLERCPQCGVNVSDTEIDTYSEEGWLRGLIK